MADEDNKQQNNLASLGRPGNGQPEVSVGRDTSLSIDVGMPLAKGQTKPQVQREPDHGLEVELGNGKAQVTRADALQKDAPQEGDDTTDKKPDGEQEGDTTEKKPEGEAAGELPDFTADNEEVVQKYDATYKLPEGKGWNMAALTADWQKNVKVDPKTGEFEGGLSENTFKYLEAQGIDRATVEAVQAGQVARLKLDQAAVFERAGGREQYGKALAWARGDAEKNVKGGYDDAAKAKFNEDLNAGGARRNDAIDLLMQRYSKANPTPRRVAPQKTAADAAAAGGDGSGVQPYKSYNDYQKDLRQARETNDQALLDNTRARFKASANEPWRKAQG